MNDLIRHYVVRYLELGGIEWFDLPAKEKEEQIQKRMDQVAKRLVADHFGCEYP